MANQQSQFMEAMKNQQEFMMKLMERSNSKDSEKEKSTKDILETLKAQSLENKKVKCPRWSKTEPLNNFAERLKYWDNSFKSRSD